MGYNYREVQTMLVETDFRANCNMQMRLKDKTSRFGAKLTSNRIFTALVVGNVFLWNV